MRILWLFLFIVFTALNTYAGEDGEEFKEQEEGVHLPVRVVPEDNHPDDDEREGDDGIVLEVVGLGLDIREEPAEAPRERGFFGRIADAIQRVVRDRRMARFRRREEIAFEDARDRWLDRFRREGGIVVDEDGDEDEVVWPDDGREPAVPNVAAGIFDNVDPALVDRVPRVMHVPAVILDDDEDDVIDVEQNPIGANPNPQQR
jgi:hypothetical protein